MLEMLRAILKKFVSSIEPHPEKRKLHELYMADLGVDVNKFQHFESQLRLPLRSKPKKSIISTGFSSWKCPHCGDPKSVAFNGDYFCRCSPKKAWN